MSIKYPGAFPTKWNIRIFNDLPNKDCSFTAYNINHKRLNKLHDYITAIPLGSYVSDRLVSMSPDMDCLWIDVIELNDGIFFYIPYSSNTKYKNGKFLLQNIARIIEKRKMIPSFQNIGTYIGLIPELSIAIRESGDDWETLLNKIQDLLREIKID